ncbi:hypothetical protein [Armatimonas sp.]|uniref:hypothetical protein n=1 Tax=Armatimonas sp. TaxID=1872638 RepID=UPI0037518418
MWQTGDFERSWETSSPEAMRFAQHLLEQAKTSMARFAANSVVSELRSQVNLPGNGGGNARTDLRVWRKLRSFGFTSPEEAARTACLNTLNTIQKSLRSQFVTHCRQSQADSSFTILHPKISELLTESSVSPLFIPSAYDTDLDEWLRATGSHSNLSSHKAILSNRWAGKTDTERIAELRTLSGRLRDALTKAGQ